MITHRVPMRRLALGALAALLAFGLAACDDGPPRQKKAQKVALLPDTPPPPPPPPKEEEKKPEPQKEDKPQQQPDAPKPVEAPQPQALKSDEAAGDGPGNGMQAGSVTQDYTNQQIGAASGPQGGPNRMQLALFSSQLQRHVQDALARNKDVKLGDYRVNIRVWFDAGGGFERVELVDSSGDPRTDEALRTALGQLPPLRAAVPENLPQPMRLRITNRLTG